MFICIGISNVLSLLCTASRHAQFLNCYVTLRRDVAGHVIKSFNAFSGAQVSSGRVWAIIQSCQWLSGVSCSPVSGLGLNFTAASCCFIREGLASRHVRRVYEFNSRGVTDDSETHYRNIVALFSRFVPITAIITAVAVTVSSSRLEPSAPWTPGSLSGPHTFGHRPAPMS